MRYNYKIKRWYGEKEIENVTLSLPIHIDWLTWFYHSEKDWTGLLIEEFDIDGKNIGWYSASKKAEKKAGD